MCSLALYVFFPFMLFNKFYVFIDFYYRLILVKKFTKYNKVNEPCYNIKYLDLYLSLNFSTCVFNYW